ncbi:hypothetical protein Pst134EA_006905 [Puccinia striiformis f. sp. tritici]|uniref:hypothetical protein n=1 Tax=Puccinia striiformis f. sp. tritici TaxID=168172 RepID=UPI00200797C6|nr:hypothetical protein Pst134EA_006905 [Puccinia striiformis f. sp. tritici]KAH9469617.1 hypothetical protein Pst134EA_006905 [Puccinia striiformis f. sp. tritici]
MISGQIFGLLFLLSDWNFAQGSHIPLRVNRLIPRRFGKEHSVDVQIADCPGEVCGSLFGEVPGVLLAGADPCAAQDLADKIITKAKTDENLKKNVADQLIEFGKALAGAEHNVPPDFTTNPPTPRKALHCLKEPKNSELNGIVIKQDPEATDKFFDPKTKKTVLLGADERTRPRGGGSQTGDADKKPDGNDKKVEIAGPKGTGGGDAIAAPKVDAGKKKNLPIASGGGNNGGGNNGGGNNGGGNNGGGNNGGGNNGGGNNGGGNNGGGNNGGGNNGGGNNGGGNNGGGNNGGGNNGGGNNGGGNNGGGNNGGGNNGGGNNGGGNNGGGNNGGGNNDGGKNDGGKNDGGKNDGGKNDGGKNDGGGKGFQGIFIDTGSLGDCNNPKIKFGGGINGRKATEFTHIPDDQVHFTHGEALDLSIITRSSCDKLLNCKLDQKDEIFKKCKTLSEAIGKSKGDGTGADQWNSAVRFLQLNNSSFLVKRIFY